MSEEVFLESLREQADNEIARILGEAEEKVRVLREEAEREASRQEESRIRDAGIEAELLRARILNEAAAEARRILLEAAHVIARETMERVAALAEQHVAGKAGAAVLEALLSECLVENDCLVTCRSRDRETLEASARRRGLHVTFAEEDLPSPGVVVSSSDGRFVQFNTFGERLRKARPAMMRIIAKALDELPDGGTGCA